MQFISDNYFYIVGVLLIGLLTVKYLKSKSNENAIEKSESFCWRAYKKSAILIATIYKYRHTS